MRSPVLPCLALVTAVQTVALAWLVHQHVFSIDAAWNRYRAGERLVLEGIHGGPEKLTRGVALMDDAHVRLVAAGEIVAITVPSGGALEKAIAANGMRDLSNGMQAMGGQRAVGGTSRTVQLDVRDLRVLEHQVPGLVRPP